MTLDTEPTIRLPVVDVPSAVITTDLHIARARAVSAHRARIQRRWDILARILSYLCFAGILGLLIGICGALFALALTMADQDAAPTPEPVTTASVTTLPSMPPTAYPLLGGVTAAATAPPSTTRPRPTPTTARPATTIPAPSATVPAPPPAAAITTATPSTTAAPTTTTPPPTDPPSTPAPTDTTTAPTDPPTTTTDPATPPTT